MSKQEMGLKFEDYVERLQYDPEFWSASVTAQANTLSISRPTLRKWRDQVDWAKINKARDARKEERVFEIENALRTKYLQGDVKAIEIGLALYKNWSLKSVVEMSVAQKNPDSEEDTRNLLVGAFVSLPVTELISTMERIFQAMPLEDRQNVLSRLGALEAVVIPFDTESAGRAALPIEVQEQLVRAERGAGNEEVAENHVKEWGDTIRAVPR